jgi:hypothetical protein
MKQHLMGGGSNHELDKPYNIDTPADIKKNNVIHIGNYYIPNKVIKFLIFSRKKKLKSKI